MIRGWTTALVAQVYVWLTPSEQWALSQTCSAMCRDYDSPMTRRLMNHARVPRTYPSRTWIALCEQYHTVVFRDAYPWESALLTPPASDRSCTDLPLQQTSVPTACFTSLTKKAAITLARGTVDAQPAEQPVSGRPTNLSLDKQQQPTDELPGRQPTLCAAFPKDNTKHDGITYRKFVWRNYLVEMCQLVLKTGKMSYDLDGRQQMMSYPHGTPYRLRNANLAWCGDTENNDEMRSPAIRIRPLDCADNEDNSQSVSFPSALTTAVPIAPVRSTPSSSPTLTLTSTPTSTLTPAHVDGPTLEVAAWCPEDADLKTDKDRYMTQAMERGAGFGRFIAIGNFFGRGLALFLRPAIGDYDPQNLHMWRPHPQTWNVYGITEGVAFDLAARKWTKAIVECVDAFTSRILCPYGHLA